MLHQLAQSHAENLVNKVEALKLQGQGLIVRRAGGELSPAVSVVGTINGNKVDEYFILDNMEALARCAVFTQKLTEISKSLPLPMGETVPLGGAA